MTPRFYAPDAQAGRTAILPDEEGEHLTRVLRLKAGASIRVFDGRGREFDATVEKAGKTQVLVAVGTTRPASTVEPAVSVTLAQAVLKGDKMDDVIRDAVMMGVAAIQPMVTARTEVSLAALQKGRRRERWQRIAVSSAKQCGRSVVPEVREPVTFDAIIGALVTLALPEPGLMFVEPAASADAVALSDMSADHRDEATMVIGPEGGWTPEEIASASAACRLVTLRGPTLRADAAAIVAMAALFALWRQY